MNPIQQLSDSVQRAIPGVWARIDAPSKPSGEWFLDLHHMGNTVVVQWREGEGFGISAVLAQPGLGEGADEMEADPKRAAARVVDLLRAR